ncbi:MAG: zinc-binding alcohol dehydrogenase [Kiritimatiellae bacterium]|nr:zinc-binding alcohol dehydrogenase [Kiritimatiellia bacterium]
MSKTVKAIVFADVNRVETREYRLGEVGPADIVVRTRYTMVSSGTELRVLGGHYGAKGRYPLVPGYSSVGEVIEVGAEAAGFRVGDRVSCRNPRPLPGINSQWGGQASLQVHATTGEDRPVLLPEGAEFLDYVTAEISAISLRGVTAAAPRPGETAVVLGQGLIGAFSAAWLNARGCRVLVADLEENRLQRARKWAAATVKISEPDAEARILAWCNGGADIVVESSGTSKGALLAHKLIRRKPQNYSKDYKVEPIQFYHGDWPRLLMQANYIENVTLDPFGFFPGEGVTILAPKDRGVEDRQMAIEQLRRGTLKAADFVQNVRPFTEAPAAYAALRDDKNRNFSLAFDWTMLSV